MGEAPSDDGATGLYRSILVALENSPYDNAVLTHVRPIARATGARLLLVHVADGFVARHQERLNLADSEEIKADRAYLVEQQERLASEGLEAESILRRGDPAEQIVGVAHERGCDLIAMATHGHRLVMDFLLGSVAAGVRHKTRIPVLLVRGDKPKVG